LQDTKSYGLLLPGRSFSRDAGNFSALFVVRRFVIW